MEDGKVNADLKLTSEDSSENSVDDHDLKIALWRLANPGQTVSLDQLESEFGESRLASPNQKTGTKQ